MTITCDRPTRRSGWIKRGVAVMVAASALIATAATSASAGPNDPKGMGFRNINIQLLGVSDTGYWGGVLQTSASRWNNSGAGTAIKQVASSGGKYQPGQYGLNVNWYGLYTTYDGNGVAPGVKCVNRRFTIQINADTIVADAPSSSVHDTWNKSTTVHEIGHALSLGHDTAANSIMNDKRQRSLVGTPNTTNRDDVILYNTGAWGC